MKHQGLSCQPKNWNKAVLIGFIVFFTFLVPDAFAHQRPQPLDGEVPRLSYGGKFKRVDIHGVPMPDRSPTGEGEDDRLPNMAYIDMYDLAPNYSVTDVAVPVEGGELTLEFRRTSGIRNFRHSTNIQNQGITYPSDFILGLGWNTNLNSQAIVAFDPDEEDPTKAVTAQVTDEVGNSYQYFDNGQTGQANPFPPDVYHSFNNDAAHTTLSRQDANTLVLVKVFGTRLTYEKVGRFLPPAPGNFADWEDYYRLSSVEDRNGNKLTYVYSSSAPENQMSFLVSEIHEAAHPERKISFAYSLGGGLNGEDRGDRLTKVTDPLGRETTFSFGVSGGQPWDLLLQVTREAVPDGEGGGVLVQPTATFSYHAVELPVEETQSPPTLPPADPTTKNRFVGLQTITDARGHVTTFNYTTDFFPSTISLIGPAAYQQKIRLISASTIDGTVGLEQDARSPIQVVTRAVDTLGNKVRYQFDSSLVPENNKIGVAIFVTDFTRTSETLPANNTAIFESTADRNANLTRVTDMNGNTIAYVYGNLASQLSNQPTLRTMTDTGSGKTIPTTYQYGIFNKMTQMMDGEGKSTNYTFDANGNRTAVNEELGKTTLYQYAPDGFVTQITDPDGRVTTFSRIFTPADLNRQYTVTSTVKGYGNELNLVTVKVSDVMGSEVEMTDPNGNLYAHQYDALYRRTRTTNPAVEASPGGPPVASTMTYTHTLNGSVVEEKDDNGNVTANQYDLMNRLTETRRRMTNPALNDDSADLITKNFYNPVGLVETTTDPNGNLTKFEYDALLRMTKKTVDANALAYVETSAYGTNAGSGAFTYTTGWQATQALNRRGFLTDNTYDGFYRLIETVRRGTGQPEPTTRMAYNKVHNNITEAALAEASAGGDRTTYTFYDDLHRPTISLLDFDGDGNNSAPYTPETTFVNNALAFTGHDAEDFVTRTTYDLAGNVTKATDREGNPTDTTYDGASRVTRVEQAMVAGGRPTTTTAYDDNGNKILMTDPNGNQTKMVYDARNRLTQSILDLNGNGQFDPLRPGTDIVTDTHYDLVTNVIQTVDPNGNVTDTAYDFAYRVLTVTGPPVRDGEPESPTFGQMVRPFTKTAYDKNSNVTQVTDPRGVKTVNTYDGLNRVISMTKAFGTPEALTTTTAYDANNNVISMTLDNGAAGLQTTAFTFDPYDREVSETWPGGNLTTTAYYQNNLVQAVTDPKGQRIESDYDRADRVTESRHLRPNNSIEETRNFTYNRMTNILTASDLNGMTTYTYDAIYRVLTETRADVGQNPYTVTSAYDLNSNRTSSTYPQTGRVISNAYDRKDRLTSVVDSIGGKTTTSTYDANSNLTRSIKPNSVRETYTYDALNRTLSHVSRVKTTETVIYSASYTYDLANQRRLIQEVVKGQPSRKLRYNYDSQYRLIKEAWQGNRYTYTYDLAGNRLTKDINSVTTTYTYNPRNELLTEATGATTTTYFYDPNGNRIQKAVGVSSSTTDYFWDVNDRLIEAKIDGATVFEAGYDYRTRRLTKTENATSTYFRYDGGVSFQEVASGTTLLDVEFVRGADMGGGIGSILYSDRSATGGGDELFTYNAVGHTVALTDTIAAVVKTDLYEAFGNIASSTGSSLNNRLANTKERDASLGLDNHGFRYYDPSTGRYLSRDPMGSIDGLNVYLSVGNNPINSIDPLGLGLGSSLLPDPKANIRAARKGFDTAFDPEADVFDRVGGAFTGVGYTMNTVLDLVPGKGALQKKIVSWVEGAVVTEAVTAGQEKLVKSGVVSDEQMAIASKLLELKGQKGKTGKPAPTTPLIPNPHGSPGNPVHKAATGELTKKMEKDFPKEEGYTHSQNKSIQDKTDLNVRPDNQVRDAQGNLVAVGEAARTNADNKTHVARERRKQAAYKENEVTKKIPSYVVTIPKTATKK